jgi:hypothetical protein
MDEVQMLGETIDQSDEAGGAGDGLDKEVLKEPAPRIRRQSGRAVHAVCRHVCDQAVARGYSEHVVQGPRVDQAAIALATELRGRPHRRPRAQPTQIRPPVG